VTSSHDSNPKPYDPPLELSDAGLRKNAGPPTSVRYLVVFALCLAAMVAYVQRNSIGVAVPDISSDLGLSKFAMGWVISSFFLTYALLQLPTGWIGKTMGTRRAMPMFAVIFSAAAAAFSVSMGVVTLFASRLAMGAAQSGIFPCAVTSISKWMPDKQRSMSAGFLASSMSIGGALGVYAIGLLIPLVGWRIGYAIFAIPGFLFAAGFYWWFRDHPKQHAGVNQAELDLIGIARTNDSITEPQDDSQHQQSETEQDEPTPWLEILTNIPILALCAQQVFRAMGYMFFASWFATYLLESRGVATSDLGLLNSLPLLAVVIGSPIGGTMSDFILASTGSRRWSRQGVAAICMLACGTLILVSYTVENAWLAVLLISAGSFFSAFGGPCSYTSTIDLGGKHLTMVFSLMNMAGNIGAVVFPLLVPWLLNEKAGEPGSGNWDLVLLVFAGMFFAAAFFWLFVNPNAGLVSKVENR